VQETIDEAISFRRAMGSMKKQVEGSWWFDVWQPEAADKKPSDSQAQWVLKPGDAWHGFEGLAADHVMVDPIKVTLLASLNGYAPQVAVEFGRKVLYSTERPTFTELESEVKQRKGK